MVNWAVFRLNFTFVLLYALQLFYFEFEQCSLDSEAVSAIQVTFI